jgi:hypothetical protein
MHTHHSINANDRVSTAPGVDLVGKARLSFIGKFSVTYESIEMLLRDEAPETFPTVVTLKSMVQHDNQVIFRQADLAQAMGVAPLTIGRHIKKLRALGLLIPDPVDSESVHTRVWRIHPKLIWRGKGEEMRDYLNKLNSNHVFRNH